MRQWRASFRAEIPNSEPYETVTRARVRARETFRVMAWLRFDDGFAGHPKIAALTDSEFRMWLLLLCHCARYRRPTVDALTRREVPGLSPKKLVRFVELGL